MIASEARLSAALVPPAPREAGFVLGAHWQQPEVAVPAPVPVPARYEPAIFQGIITHYVDPDRRPMLKDASDHLRLVEDLGLDSLAMIEVMLRVEDLLKIRVSDDDLRHFRTLGEVRLYLERTSRESAQAIAHA